MTLNFLALVSGLFLFAGWYLVPGLVAYISVLGEPKVFYGSVVAWLAVTILWFVRNGVPRSH